MQPMDRFRRVLMIVCVVLGWCSVPDRPAGAQEREEDVNKSAAPVSGATMDVGDLWRRLWHRPPPDVLDPADAARRKAFVVAPTLGSKPSTGLSLGLATNIAFFEGDPNTTHISTANAGLRVTQKHQVLAGVRFSIFTDHDRWFLQGDNRASLTSQGTYGLGTDTLATDVVSTKYTYTRIFETVYRQISHHLFVGAGLDVDTHANVRPGSTKAAATWDHSPFVTYSELHQFSVSNQTSAGTSMNVLFDTRDGGINPTHGWLANASYRTFFSGFLGGDSSWQELYLDTRTYRKLTSSGRHKLAFWMIGDFVTSGTAPYLDLPTIAVDGRSGRGYGEGRFRGDRLMYGEVEYRGTLSPNGMFGMVLFLNTTTVSDTVSHLQLGDSFATGAGLGLRVLLNKRSRTNLCADYGWGKQDSRGFYLSIQESF
jgi:Omp85 superfamily domain